MSEASAGIQYRKGNELDVDAVIEVYRDSGLGVYRPVDDRDAMAKMLAGANLVIAAFDGDKLVGVARSLTDGVYCTYLSDLAVRREYQRKGIGKELMKRTQKAGGTATIYLFAAPEAVDYYPHTGFTRGSGFYLPRMSKVR